MRRCWLVLLLALGGCGQPGGSNVATPVTEVTVAAAADLKFAFDEIVTACERDHPGIKINATYGSSGSFFAQLANKAPFDLFLSADAEFPRKLVELGHAPKGAEFTYAVGHLVLWVPKSSPLDVVGRGYACLLDPSVKKIAIANPKFAPYGRAAEAALKKWGLDEKISDKIVLGDNISQTAQFVETGGADIGLLARSLAVAPALKDKGKFWDVPSDAYPPLVQAGVILSWAKNHEAAAQVQQCLLTKTGLDILVRYGFSLPGK